MASSGAQRARSTGGDCGERPPPALARRSLFALCLLLVPGERLASAESSAVPPTVQAELVSKVPNYDRAFRERAGTKAHVLVLARKDHSESIRTANYVAAAIQHMERIGGLPSDVGTYTYVNAPALTGECKRREVSILYVTPGFDAELPAICGAVEPLGVMTFTGVPEYVPRCVIVGFDVAGGKPKLLVHLTQAKKAGIRFTSELLKVATVYQ